MSERGFSLIEVIVALGILSTAAVGLGTLSQQSIDGVKQMEARYLARAVADQQMAAMFVDIVPPDIGETTGDTEQMSRAFEWTQTVSPSGRNGLLLVEVRVTPAGEDTVLAKATTLRSDQP